MKTSVTTLTLLFVIAVSCNQIHVVSGHIRPLGHVRAALSSESLQDPTSDTSKSKTGPPLQSSLSTGVKNLESKRKLLTFLPATYQKIDLIQVLSGNPGVTDTCLSHLSIDDVLSSRAETMALIPFQNLSLWPMSDLENKVKCERLPTNLTGILSDGVTLFKFSEEQLREGRDGVGQSVRQLNCSSITMAADNPQYPLWLRRMFKGTGQSKLPSDLTLQEIINDKQGDGVKNGNGNNNTPEAGGFSLSMRGNIKWFGRIPGNIFSCVMGNETHMTSVTLPAYTIFVLDSVNFFNAFAETVKRHKEVLSKSIIVPHDGNSQARITTERLSTAKRLVEDDPNLVDEIGHYFLMIETNSSSCMYVQPRAKVLIEEMLTITETLSQVGPTYNIAATGTMENISITHLKPCPCSSSFPDSFRMRISGRRAMDLDQQMSRRLSSSLDDGASFFVINRGDLTLKIGNVTRDETEEGEDGENVGEMTIDLNKTGPCKVLNATRVSTVEKRLRNDGPPYDFAKSLPVMAVLLKYFQEATGDLSVDGLELLVDAAKMNSTLRQMRAFGSTSVLVVIEEGSRCGAFNVERPMAVLFEHRLIVSQMVNSSFMRALSNVEREILATTIPMSDTIDLYTAHLFIAAVDSNFSDDIDDDIDDEMDDEDDDEDRRINSDEKGINVNRQSSKSRSRQHYGEMFRFETCAFTASRRVRGLMHDMCRVFQPLGIYVTPLLIESPSPSFDIAATWLESPEPSAEAWWEDPSTTISAMTDGNAKPSQEPDVTRSEKPSSPMPFEAEATAAAPDNPDPEIGDEGEIISRGACFPAHALVPLVVHGDRSQFARMDEVSVGDVVAGRDGQVTTVIGLSHADAHAVADFVILHTHAGTSIALTDGHYVPSRQRLVVAGAVTVGDPIELGNGSHSVVTRVMRARMRGLYSPVTDSGYVAVAFAQQQQQQRQQRLQRQQRQQHQKRHRQVQQGTVVASCFTTAVKPDVATALAGPLRWAARMGGVCVPMLTKWLGQGSQFWTRWLPSGDASVRV